MNQLEKAQHIGINQSTLWKIYHGFAYPGKTVSEKLEKVTGKEYKFWRTSKLSTIQRVLDAIE